MFSQLKKDQLQGPLSAQVSPPTSPPGSELCLKPYIPRAALPPCPGKGTPGTGRYLGTKGTLQEASALLLKLILSDLSGKHFSTYQIWMNRVIPKVC